MPLDLRGPAAILFISRDTVVAEMTTELIRFEPEICICNGNGNELQFKRESVTVMRDFLLKSVSVIENNSSGSAILYL